MFLNTGFNSFYNYGCMHFVFTLVSKDECCSSYYKLLTVIDICCYLTTQLLHPMAASSMIMIRSFSILFTFLVYVVFHKCSTRELCRDLVELAWKTSLSFIFKSMFPHMQLYIL